MSSGDGHLSDGQAAPRETGAGEGAGAPAAILAPETAAAMAAAARALIGAVTREQQVVLNPGFDDHPGGPGVLPPAPWGWQFAGHHVVLDFTAALPIFAAAFLAVAVAHAAGRSGLG